MKLAIGLIAFLILLSIPSTLIEQGRESSYYLENHGRLGGQLILGLGLDNVFNSPLFLSTAGIFGLNLGYCSLWRFVRELGRKGHKRHGPDILHLGLLVFFAGSLITALFSEESSVVWMDSGDSVVLPREGVFTLESFQTLSYQDGRPASWISNGTYIPKKGNPEPVEIKVNSPGRLEGLKIYQNSFRWRYALKLKPPDRAVPLTDRILEEGDTISNLIFFAVRTGDNGNWDALFINTEGDTVVVEGGSMLADWKLDSYNRHQITGLQFARDPGVPVVFASFLPIAVGLMMIVYEKRKSI